MNWRVSRAIGMALRVMPFAGTLILSGCVEGQTVVLTPARSAMKVSEIMLVYEPSRSPIPPDAVARLQRVMEARFFGRGKSVFRQGNGMTLRYSIIGFEGGDRFARWALGGAGRAGEANIMLHARFLDGSGRLIAELATSGAIRKGVLLGGSSSSALERAADEIATYAEVHFH